MLGVPGGGLTLPACCRFDASLATGLAVRACLSLVVDDRDHVVAANEPTTGDAVDAVVDQIHDQLVEGADICGVHVELPDDRVRDVARAPTGEVGSLLRRFLEHAVEPSAVDLRLLRHDALLPL